MRIQPLVSFGLCFELKVWFATAKNSKKKNKEQVVSGVAVCLFVSVNFDGNVFGNKDDSGLGLQILYCTFILKY